MCNESTLCILVHIEVCITYCSITSKCSELNLNVTQKTQTAFSQLYMDLFSFFKNVLGKEESADSITTLSVELTRAGSLSEKVSESQATSIRDLTIVGDMDGDDLSYLHRYFTSLVSLDLSGATLHSGRFLCAQHKNFYEFADNELAGHTLHLGKLRKVVLPESVTDVTVSNFADIEFGQCSDRSVFTRMSGAFGGMLECIKVPEGNKNYSSYNGMLFDKALTTLLKCPLAHPREVSFPPTLKVINANAFRECSKIQEIIIPEGVTVIGEKAFYDCDSLSKLSIPSTTSTIEDDAFAHSYNLTTLECAAKKPVSITINRSSSVEKCTLKVPAGSESEYGTAPYWSEFRRIVSL